MIHLRYDLKIISRITIGMVGLHALTVLANAFLHYKIRAFAINMIDEPFIIDERAKIDGLFKSDQGFNQSAAEIHQLETYFAISLMAATAAFLIAVIVSGVWIYRASANASQLQPIPSRITPGWSVGWFFVPFANLLMPYRAMCETWNTSVDPTGQNKRGAPFWLTAWWITWVVTSIAANLEMRMIYTIVDAESMRMASTVSLVIAPFDLLCAYLYILVIRRITDQQSNARLDVATTFARGVHHDNL